MQDTCREGAGGDKETVHPHDQGALRGGFRAPPRAEDACGRGLRAGHLRGPAEACVDCRGHGHQGHRVLLRQCHAGVGRVHGTRVCAGSSYVDELRGHRVRGDGVPGLREHLPGV